MEILRYRYHWALLLFCLVDLFAFARLTPYDAVGSQLLENPGFLHGAEGWKLEGDPQRVRLLDGALTIEHGSAPGITVLSQCHAAGRLPSRLLFSAKAMSRGVARGEASWHEARIDLVGYDSLGEADYRTSTSLLGMRGTREWAAWERIYRNAPEYRRLCVEVSLYQAPGEFRVKELSLRQARENGVYRWVSLSLLAGWAVLGLWLARGLFEHFRGRPQAGYLLALLCLLLAGVLMPHEWRAGLEAQILTLLTHLGLAIAPGDTLSQGGPLDLWPVRWSLAKLSHMAGFALLAGILFGDARDSTLARLFGLLLLAMASELLQFYVPERTPRLSDVMVDGLGILLGWALGSLWQRLRGWAWVR